MEGVAPCSLGENFDRTLAVGGTLRFVFGTAPVVDKMHSKDDSSRRREARRVEGRALRTVCPRAGHASVLLGRDDRDPLALLEQSNEGRVAHLLPVRFTRMLESPFAFFRGTAILQAHDLQGTPAAGIIVQSCGDCHLLNFGAFASPERTLLFDINDFDETLPAPFEWDVKRLATSFVLAARWRGFNAGEARGAAEGLVTAYRTHMARFSEMKILEVWYARETVDDLTREVAQDVRLLKRVNKLIDKAKRHTTEVIFHELTHQVDGRPRMVDHPPLLYHVDDSVMDMELDVRPFFAAYRRSLPADRRALFDRFELVDVAVKVVGIGAVGTRCFVTLWMGDSDDPLFLQTKEARRSVLEGAGRSTPYQNHGERVVVGQRLMQSASDIFLGWSRGTQGGNPYDFYVRQLRDQKAAADLPSMDSRTLCGYAKICGRTLARAHAKSGESAAICGYLGTGTNFDEAITAYAVGYADQVEQDYELFRTAVRSGRFPLESLRSGLEEEIR